MGLSHILGGMSPHVFFRDYWEQDVLHMRPSSRERFSLLALNINAVDGIIASASSLVGHGDTPALYQRDVKVVRRHRTPSGESFTQGYQPPAPHGNVSLKVVHSMFKRGFSVVVNALNHRHTAVSQLCEELSAHFGVKVNANLYFTPPSAEAFDPHMDWMDSFVLQLEGTKEWRFHAEPRVRNAYVGILEKPAQLKEPSRVVQVHPGDVLYVPRGLVHEVVAGVHQPSLHLTLGVEVERGQTWEPILELALSQGEPPCWVPRGMAHIVAQLAAEARPGLLRQLILPPESKKGEVVDVCGAIRDVDFTREEMHKELQKHDDWFNSNANGTQGAAAHLHRCCSLSYQIGHTKESKESPLHGPLHGPLFEEALAVMAAEFQLWRNNYTANVQRAERKRKTREL